MIGRFLRLLLNPLLLLPIVDHYVMALRTTVIDQFTYLNFFCTITLRVFTCKLQAAEAINEMIFIVA